MTEQGGYLYRALRRFVRGTLHVYYRTIEVTGSELIPQDRPTILAANHPNSIIDPLFVGLFETRQVSFCARDGLFKVPLFGRLLRSIGAIPIYRRSDHKEGSNDEGVDNRRAFEACREVLARGGVLSIFPEGKTHARLRVEQLRTGVARIALDAERDRTEPLGVCIVPVALNYLVRQAFRSDVHVSFGKPIDVAAEFGALAQQDERQAVRALTDRLETALKAQVIHVEQQEDERIIAQITSIIAEIRASEGLDTDGQSPAERTALVQRILDAYRWYGTVQPDATAELRRRIAHYIDTRVRFGLGGESSALQHRSEGRQRAERQHRRRMLFLVAGAPLALYGIIGTVVPYTLLRLALSVAQPTAYRQALVKLLGGALIFLGCFVAEGLAVAWLWGGGAAALYGLSIIPVSLFTLRYTTEIKLHRLSLRSVWLRFARRDRLIFLREERSQLRHLLAEMRTRYLEHLGQIDGATPP